MSHNNFVLCKAMSHNALFCVPALCFFLLVMVCCLPYYWLLLTLFLCLVGFDFILNWLISYYFPCSCFLLALSCIVLYASCLNNICPCSPYCYFFIVYIFLFTKQFVFFCYFIFFIVTKINLTVHKVVLAMPWKNWT